MQITQAAQTKIRDLLRQEREKSYLRLNIQGGGCSGFQYVFSFDQILTDDDLVFEDMLVIDRMSLSLLEGGHLDYKDEMARSGFVIMNPGAVSSCGCGNSFSI